MNIVERVESIKRAEDARELRDIAINTANDLRTAQVRITELEKQVAGLQEATTKTRERTAFEEKMAIIFPDDKTVAPWRVSASGIQGNDKL